MVEVQQTFYQPPSIDTVKRWRDEAPHDFEFTLKAWQLITHEASSPTYRRLKVKLSNHERCNVGSFRWSAITRRAWDETVAIATALGADKIVFQCPASFRPTQENKDRLRIFFTRIERQNFTLIWEPRGKWEKSEIKVLCEELGLIQCVDPFKDEPTATRFLYFRLHGIGGYRYSYSDEELAQLVTWISRVPTAYVMFNNIKMLDDALRLKELLSQQSKPWHSE